MPVIPGVKPLSTLRQLTLLPETFAIELPEALRSEVRTHADRPEAIRRIGVEWAVDQCRRLKAAGVPVIHFYTMGRAENVRQIIKGGILTMADELDIIAFRRALHRRPELSFRETGTHDLIARTLDGLGIAHRTSPARASWHASKAAAIFVVGSRPARRHRRAADPRTGRRGVALAQRRVMHACGHDVHTAVLMGVLQELNRSRATSRGRFGSSSRARSATPEARRWCWPKSLADYDVRAVVGEHVEPSLEVGTFDSARANTWLRATNCASPYTAQGGHAALRNQLYDPVAAAAELVGGLLAPQPAGARPLDRPHRGRRRDERRPRRRPARRDAAHLRRGAALRLLRRDPRHRRLRRPPVRHTDGRRHRAGLSLRGQRPRLASPARSLAAERWQAVDLPLRTTAEDFGFYTHRYPSLFYRLESARRRGNSIHRPSRPTRRPSPRA